MFEEISRSHEFERDYNELKEAMQKAEADTQNNMDKRRGIAQEKRAAKMERDEAEKYQQIKDDLAQKERMLYLLELFYCERLTKEANDELKKKKGEVAELEGKKVTVFVVFS